jgi:hypothetical protein
MDDGLVGGFFIDFAVNPVLAGGTGRDLPFKRDKERFRGNIKVSPAPLDIKTTISFPYADIAEIPPYKVLGKEPFSYPLEFTRIHVSHLFFMQNSFAYSTIRVLP